MTARNRRVQENAANGLANRQAALALAPDIPVSARNLLASGFSFRLRLVVASGRRGGAGGFGPCGRAEA